MTGILFATHGGASAEGAGRVAVLLAERRRTKLHVICVEEPLPVVDGGFGVVYAPTPDEQDAVQRALSTAVEDQLKRCGCVHGAKVSVGIPAGEIASMARVEGVETIVVGLGPHHLIDRALGHETALQLVQMASTPVLAVPANARALPHRVLAAIDFSPTSIASLRLSASWLVSGDVIQLATVTSARTGGDLSARRIAAEGALARIAEELDLEGGVTIEKIVAEGDPATQLLEIAARTKADLLALGTHGYGIWKRLTIGSVASKVIRLSPISVLVAPIGSLATAHRASVPSVS